MRLGTNGLASSRWRLTGQVHIRVPAKGFFGLLFTKLYHFVSIENSWINDPRLNACVCCCFLILINFFLEWERNAGSHSGDWQMVCALRNCGPLTSFFSKERLGHIICYSTIIPHLNHHQRRINDDRCVCVPCARIYVQLECGPFFYECHVMKSTESRQRNIFPTKIAACEYTFEWSVDGECCCC